MEREFNLLCEPWIRVMNADSSVSEVSWRDALLRAERYADLAGELPTQDIAVLRQLLAMLSAVFLRHDAEGNEREIQTVQEAVERWASIWRLGRFPEAPLQAYFEQWKDRFWLFDEARPFGQVPEASIGTEYGAAKLNGELSESSNKLRLFPIRTGEGKEKLTFAEAARWLIYVNAFDDTSAKPKGKNLPSSGAGWLGKIGLIQAVGKNLFETLMLNLPMAKDGTEIWGSGQPSWELEQSRVAERTEIAVPNHPAALLTLQSRRLLLRAENGEVTGYSLLGGDFFNKAGAYAEQMTVWTRIQGKKNEPDIIQPRRHDAARQMWRDLASIVEQSDDGKNARLPGVVKWVQTLRQRRYLQKGQMAKFRIASVQYGDKDFFVTDVFSDSLSFHADLLTQVGEDCRRIALDEILRCNDLAKYTGIFADKLCKAAGERKDKKTDRHINESAKEEVYFLLDEPFRRWLEQLDPDDPDQQEESVEQWRAASERIVLNYGRELADRAGPAAFKGRYFAEEEGKGENAAKQHYCTAEAYNWFLNKILSIRK